MILWSLWFIQNLWAISSNKLVKEHSPAEVQEVLEAKKYVRSQQHRPAPLVAGIAVMVREMVDQSNFLPLDESVREMESVRNSLKTTLESLSKREAQKLHDQWDPTAKDFGGFESLRVLHTSSRKSIFARREVPRVLVDAQNWTPRASVELYEKTSMINPSDRIWVFRRKIRADEALELANHINDQAHQLDYQRIQILNLEEMALLRGGRMP